jgi:hypothetical protein
MPRTCVASAGSVSRRTPRCSIFAQTVKALALGLTGHELKDETQEYWSVNVGLGVLLLGARTRHDSADGQP